ncbi:MAG: alanine racemase [Sphingopyxis sp.]|uniref:alanine racemase n=1 Tax=Sphingopyxis sp. TaxID=1908224 RepID=UPI002ABC3B60|nr:alanine racemase [Sphingopyxis sp.]MDZ3830785.1 alanine racemase [Sphingopyxis sp.]
MHDRRIIHESGRLRIDLGAIVQNYRMVAMRSAPATVGAVVKADAYGLGAVQVARTLREAGCRLFFVAHLDEALHLRTALSADDRIIILNGLPPGTEALCAASRFVPVLNSLDQARRWRDAADAAGRSLPAVLQVDSGMSRLGLAPEDLAVLAGDELFDAAVDLAMLMSHLACADTPDHPANRDQLARFEAAASLFPDVSRTLANSGGAFLSPAFHGDIVRAGIALYGGAPHDGAPNPMQPVVGLDARVIQLRTVPAGCGIGYGHDHRCTQDSRIATIGVGYADGLPRTLGNRGAAWLGDVRLPIVGRVSMDSITLDVTALPPGRLQPGDWVELIGPRQPVDALARDAGTISYEILTSLGTRYHRSYRAADAGHQARAA